MGVLGLRGGGYHSGKRSSHSQWSQELDSRKWRQIFCLTLLDFFFHLTNDNEGRGGLGNEPSPYVRK